MISKSADLINMRLIRWKTLFLHFIHVCLKVLSNSLVEKLNT